MFELRSNNKIFPTEIIRNVTKRNTKFTNSFQGSLAPQNIIGDLIGGHWPPKTFTCTSTENKISSSIY